MKAILTAPFSFTGTGFLKNIATSEIGGIILISESIAAIFSLMTILWMIAKGLSKPSAIIEGNKEMWSEIYRIVLILIIIAIYKPLFLGIIDFADTVISISYIETPITEKEKAKLIMENFKKKADDDVGSFWGMLSLGTSVVIGNVLGGAIGSSLKSIFLILNPLVVGFATLLKYIFFLIGPYVLAFSILPFNKDKLERWFGVFLLFCFVPIILNLLNFVNDSVMLYWSTGGLTLDDFGVGFIIYTVIMIIAYLLSFWLTSFIIGNQEAGKFASTAAALGTQAVGFIGGGLGGGLGGAGGGLGGGGGGSDVSSAASLTDDITKK